MSKFGDLYDYTTGAYVRAATQQELEKSRSAAEWDGGVGAFGGGDGRTYWVDESSVDEAEAE